MTRSLNPTSKTFRTEMGLPERSGLFLDPGSLF
jgi:hypothetical protein